MNPASPSPRVSASNFLQPGWAMLDGKVRAHFYAAGESHSLCGQVHDYVGPRDDSGHQHPANCAHCREMRLHLIPVEAERKVA